MDHCVDCHRLLRDLFCRTCSMIYVPEVNSSMSCRNCGHQMIKSKSKTRHICGFCQYRYFAFSHYDSTKDEALKEYMSSLERECPECMNRMTINPATQELVCTTCGLVYEDPIYTRL